MKAQSLNVTIQWEEMMTDFETACRNAISAAFPQVRLFECYFHFCQSLFQHIQQDRRLLYLYYDYKHFGFRQFAVQLMALAFLPTEEVHNVYHLICEEYQLLHRQEYQCECLGIFIAYFERQYLQDNRLLERNISEWNIYL